MISLRRWLRWTQSAGSIERRLRIAVWLGIVSTSGCAEHESEPAPPPLNLEFVVAAPLAAGAYAASQPRAFQPPITQENEAEPTEPPAPENSVDAGHPPPPAEPDGVSL